MSDPKLLRLPALRRFAAAITVLNVVGHTVLGFEQSWVTPLVGLAVAYGMELSLEALEAWRTGQRPRFLGPGTTFVDFLLSAHITGLAVSMLVYAGERLWPVAFGTAVAVASKHLLRVRVGNGSRHFLNPSNTGITATLLLFPNVGGAPPYMFTEKLGFVGSLVLPLIMVAAGSFLNARFTHKLPLIGGWLGGFALQAAVRHALLGNALIGSLVPMTGVAFLLFTFYMVTDPATSPTAWRRQIVFGGAVAATYSLLVALHVVFGLFFALTLVCCGRGALLYFQPLAALRRHTARLAGPLPAAGLASPGLRGGEAASFAPGESQPAAEPAAAMATTANMSTARIGG